MLLFVSHPLWCVLFCLVHYFPSVPSRLPPGAVSSGHMTDYKREKTEPISRVCTQIRGKNKSHAQTASCSYATSPGAL